jgi:hypothetical protein
MRALKEKLDAAETQTRHSTLDRQRFIAYLEEGLAMLGAIPPSAESRPVIKIPPDGSAANAAAALEQAPAAPAAPPTSAPVVTIPSRAETQPGLPPAPPPARQSSTGIPSMPKPDSDKPT